MDIVKLGRLSVLAAVLAMGLVLTSCAQGLAVSDEVPIVEDVAPATQTPESPLPSAAPSPSAAPTPSAEAMSALEGTPEVELLRLWASVYAEAVNNGEVDASSLRLLVAYGGLNAMAAQMRSEEGFTYPGPWPFTPMRILRDESGLTGVAVCYVHSGFAEVPDAAVLDPLRVDSVIFILEASTGSYRIAYTVPDDETDCSAVKIDLAHW